MIYNELYYGFQPYSTYNELYELKANEQTQADGEKPKKTVEPKKEEHPLPELQSKTAEEILKEVNIEEYVNSGEFSKAIQQIKLMRVEQQQAEADNNSSSDSSDADNANNSNEKISAEAKEATDQAAAINNLADKK